MVIGSNILAGSSGQGGGYNISRSLRFRASATAYLSRTPASSGTRTSWTWSDWIKRGSLGSFKTIFTTNDAVNNSTEFYFNTDDTIKFREYASSAGGYTAELYTTQVFRDPSAWYHVMLVWDSNNGTSSDRLRLYINGVRVTSFSTANYPTSGRQTFFNSAYLTTIGVNSSSSTFDGYRTEVNFIDGQALTPSSFGETSSTTGVWQPKRYTGTYGTNGFYLPFSDNTSTTTLGADSSGNGNNWTLNNFSLTAGYTYDSMTDVPTLTSATASNFCVMNPVANFTGTLSNGNLTLVTTVPGNDRFCQATFKLPKTGKWYWENTISIANSADARNRQVIANAEPNGTSFGSINAYFNCHSAVIISTATVNSNLNSAVITGGGGTVAFAYDADAGSLWMIKDSSINTGSTANVTGLSNANGDLAYMITEGSGSVSGTNNLNFGQRPFAYTPPTGFVSLNTFNLPTPTIGATASSQANKYMDVTTWTGDNVNNRLIANSGSMQPDFVWVKARNQAYSHTLYDVIRGGANKLSSNLTDAESTNYANGQVSFQPTGFNAVAGSNGLITINETGSTYVGWQWKANGTGVTNTAGSITSTVSANTTSGFSIITYTGNGSAGATIGHGLGVAPSMVICKSRNPGGANQYRWTVGHKSLGWSNTAYINLDYTGAAGFDGSHNMWNSTAPSSTVITLGNDSYGPNISGASFVCYAFAEVAGFSKFGSYTGNGSTDGVFVYTGFKPKFIITKNTSGTGNWQINDTSRDTYNVAGLDLYANSSSAESDDRPLMDILSNGFKLRNTYTGINTNGSTYIYMAFAEFPFRYSLAR